MTLTVHPTLYQVDSKGKQRFWRMETEGGKHRTVSGLIGGKEVVSGWVVCEAKNVGRANATTVEEQAEFETKADYKLKLDRKYYSTLDEAVKAGSGKKFVAPMLAEKWKEQEKKIPVAETLWVQPKLDGIRATLTRTDMLSREGKLFTSSPHIHEALYQFFDAFPDAELDGELYNHMLKADFNKISSLIKREKSSPEQLEQTRALVQYHVYDVGSHPGTFAQRDAWLKANLPESFCVTLVATYEIEGAYRDSMMSHYGLWLEEGYEGMMVRRDGLYERGRRSKSLMKLKEFFDSEYPVEELIEGKGDWTGCVKAIKFRMPNDKRKSDGQRPEAGCRGTKEFLGDMWRRYKETGFIPKLATVRYPNLTPDGFPRFGVVTRFYDGDRDD